jgi:Protein of unknown function (DUF1647)
MTSYANNEFTIVTGSDITHAKSLLNLLSSIKRHAPTANVIVYDLGLTTAQRRNLIRKFDCTLKTFDFSAYPAYFNIRIAAGEYAWKPTIIAEVAKQHSGVVWWMDAGNIITESLTPTFQNILETGFFYSSSGGTIGKWTHPAMLKYFNLPEDWKTGDEMLAATSVAFDTQNKLALKLLMDWAKFALIKECIAPEGSNRTNHRQDQALLAVLAGMQNWPDPIRSKSIPIAFHQDVDGGIKRFIRRTIKWAKRLLLSLLR